MIIAARSRIQCVTISLLTPANGKDTPRNATHDHRFGHHSVIWLIHERGEAIDVESQMTFWTVWIEEGIERWYIVCIYHEQVFRVR